MGRIRHAPSDFYHGLLGVSQNMCNYLVPNEKKLKTNFDINIWRNNDEPTMN